MANIQITPKDSPASAQQSKPAQSKPVVPAQGNGGISPKPVSPNSVQTQPVSQQTNAVNNGNSFAANFQNQWKNADSGAGSYPTLGDSFKFASYLRDYDNTHGTNYYMGFSDDLKAQMQNPNSSLYSPYYFGGSNATIRSGIGSLGLEVPDDIDMDYINSLGSMVDWSAVKYTNAGAISQDSKNPNQMLAYYYNQLAADEAATEKAEQELYDLQNYVNLWVKQGYSDDAIRSKANDIIANQLTSLYKLDEGVLKHVPVMLNRSVKYNPYTVDSYIYAARNGSDYADFESNLLGYASGSGVKYVPDEASEAARDSRQRDTYNPYYTNGNVVGSAASKLAVKYGVTKFDKKWLENNKSIDSKDFDKISTYVTNSESAENELNTLNVQIDEWIKKGKSAAEIMTKLNGHIASQNGTASGKSYLETNFPTLYLMDKKRVEGSELEMGYGVDFAMNYLEQKIQAKIDSKQSMSTKAEAGAGAATIAKEDVDSAISEEPVSPDMKMMRMAAGEEDIPDSMKTKDHEEFAKELDKVKRAREEREDAQKKASDARIEEASKRADELDGFVVSNFNMKQTEAVKDELAAYLKGVSVDELSEDTLTWLAQYGVMLEGNKDVYTEGAAGEVGNSSTERHVVDFRKNTGVETNFFGQYVSDNTRDDYMGDTMYNFLVSLEDHLEAGDISANEYAQAIVTASTIFDGARSQMRDVESFINDTEYGSALFKTINNIVDASVETTQKAKQEQFETERAATFKVLDTLSSAMMFGVDISGDDNVMALSALMNIQSNQSTVFSTEEREAGRKIALAKGKEYFKDAPYTTAFQYAVSQRFNDAYDRDVKIAEYLGFESMDEYFNTYPEALNKYSEQGIKAIKTDCEKVVEAVNEGLLDKEANVFNASFSNHILNENYRKANRNYETSVEQYKSNQQALAAQGQQATGEGFGTKNTVLYGVAMGFDETLNSFLNAYKYFFTEKDDDSVEAEVRAKFEERSAYLNYLNYTLPRIMSEDRKNYWMNKLTNYEGDIYDFGFAPSQEGINELIDEVNQSVIIDMEVLRENATPEEMAAAQDIAGLTNNVLNYVLDAGVTAATGIPFAGVATVYGTTTLADQYYYLREKGLSREESKKYAYAKGISTVAQEYMTDLIFGAPFGHMAKASGEFAGSIALRLGAKETSRLMRFVKSGSRGLVSFALDIAGEGLEEASETIVGNALNKSALSADQYEAEDPFESFKAGMKGAIPLTLIGSLNNYLGHGRHVNKSLNAIARTAVNGKVNIDAVTTQMLGDAYIADAQDYSLAKETMQIAAQDLNAVTDKYNAAATEAQQAVDDAKAALDVASKNYETLQSQYQQVLDAINTADNVSAELAKEFKESSDALNTVANGVENLTAEYTQKQEAYDKVQADYHTEAKQVLENARDIAQQNYDMLVAEEARQREEKRVEIENALKADIDKNVRESVKELAEMTGEERSILQERVDYIAYKLLKQEYAMRDAIESSVAQNMNGWNVEYRDDLPEGIEAYVNPIRQQIVMNSKKAVSTNTKLSVLSHEFLHILKEKNLASFNSVSEKVKDYAYTAQGKSDAVFDEDVKKIQDAYFEASNGEVQLTTDQAREELTANIIRDVIYGGDVKALRQLVFGKLQTNVVSKMAEAVNSWFAMRKSTKNMSAEDRSVYKRMVEIRKEFRKGLAEGFKKGTKNSITRLGDSEYDETLADAMKRNGMSETVDTEALIPELNTARQDVQNAADAAKVSEASEGIAQNVENASQDAVASSNLTNAIGEAVKNAMDGTASEANTSAVSSAVGEVIHDAVGDTVSTVQIEAVTSAFASSIIESAKEVANNATTESIQNVETASDAGNVIRETVSEVAENAAESVPNTGLVSALSDIIRNTVSDTGKAASDAALADSITSAVGDFVRNILGDVVSDASADLLTNELASAAINGVKEIVKKSGSQVVNDAAAAASIVDGIISGVREKAAKTINENGGYVIPPSAERAETLKNIAEKTFNDGTQVIVDDATQGEIEAVADIKNDGLGANIVVSVPSDSEMTAMKGSYPFLYRKKIANDIETFMESLADKDTDIVIWQGITDSPTAPKFQFDGNRWMSRNPKGDTALTERILADGLVPEYIAKSSASRYASELGDALMQSSVNEDADAVEYSIMIAENNGEAPTLDSESTKEERRIDALEAFASMTDEITPENKYDMLDAIQSGIDFVLSEGILTREEAAEVRQMADYATRSFDAQTNAKYEEIKRNLLRASYDRRAEKLDKIRSDVLSFATLGRTLSEINGLTVEEEAELRDVLRNRHVFDSAEHLEEKNALLRTVLDVGKPSALKSSQIENALKAGMISEAESERLKNILDDIAQMPNRAIDENETPVNERDDMDVSSLKENHPFYNSHPYLASYAKDVAEWLQFELSQAAKGVRWAVENANSVGDYYEYHGAKRIASESVAYMLDNWKWTYAEIEKRLDTFVDKLRKGEALPNTSAMKRIEVLVDTMLSNGYTNYDGRAVSPDVSYKEIRDGKAYVSERIAPEIVETENLNADAETDTEVEPIVLGERTVQRGTPEIVEQTENLNGEPVAEAETEPIVLGEREAQWGNPVEIVNAKAERQFDIPDTSVYTGDPKKFSLAIKDILKNQFQKYIPSYDQNNPLYVVSKLAEDVGTRMYDLGKNFSNKFANRVDAFSNAIVASAEDVQGFNDDLWAVGYVVGDKIGITDVNGTPFTDWFVDYLYSRPVNDVDVVEDALKNAGIYESVKEAKDRISAYSNYNAVQRISSFIVMNGTTKPKTSVFERILHAIDKSTIAYDVDKYTGDNKLQEKILYNNHTKGTADYILETALKDKEGNVVGKSLKAAVFDEHGIDNTNIEEFTITLLAKHALDRLAQGKGIFDENVVTEAELRNIVANAKPKMLEAVEAYSKWWNTFMKTWAVGNIITKEEYDLFQRDYPYYVPTHRDMSNEGTHSGMPKESVFIFHTAKGSSLPILNPIADTIRQVREIVDKVNRNDIARTFDEIYSSTAGMGAVAEYIGTTKSTAVYAAESLGYDSNDFKKEDDVGANYNNRNSRDILNVYMPDGTTKQYAVHNPELLNLLNGTLKPSQATGVLKAIGKLTRYMSFLTTAGNPLFALTNAARDLQSSVNHGTWASNYISGALKWIPTFAEVAYNKAFGGALKGTEEYKEYVRMGANDYSVYRMDVSDNKSVQDMMRILVPKYGQSNIEYYGRKGLKQVMLMLSFNPDFLPLQDIIETTSRYVQYKHGIDPLTGEKYDKTTFEGRKRAFMSAQEATVDFKRQNGFDTLKQVVPFLGATIQGTYQTARYTAALFNSARSTAQERAQARQYLAKTALNSTIAGALSALTVCMFGDDDDKWWYRHIADAMKGSYFLLPTFSGDNDVRPFARIPIAQDPFARAFGYLGQCLPFIVSGQSDMCGDVMDVASAIISDMLPLSTIIDPLLQAIGNKTHYDSDIDSAWQMKNLPVTSRRNSSTNIAFEWLSNLLNGIGINSDVISPNRLEYLVTQYGGYAGNLIVNFALTDKDRAFSAYKTIRNRFTLGSYSNNVTDAYEEAQNFMNNAVTSAKYGYDVKDAAYGADLDAMMADITKFTGKGSRWSVIQNEITKINDQMYAVYNNPDLSSSEIEKQADSYHRQVVMLQEEALDLFNQQIGNKYVGNVADALMNTFVSRKVSMPDPRNILPDAFEADSNEPYMKYVFDLYEEVGNDKVLPEISYAFTHTNSVTKEKKEYMVERGTYSYNGVYYEDVYKRMYEENVKNFIDDAGFTEYENDAAKAKALQSAVSSAQNNAKKWYLWSVGEYEGTNVDFTAWMEENFNV